MNDSAKPTLLELLREGFSGTARGYDLIAPKFDTTPFRTPESILRTSVKQIAAGGPVDAALDIGCGTGAAMRAFAPLCRDRLVGLDLSRGMLGVARRNLRDCPTRAAIRFVQGDVLDAPFGREFDLVTSFGMLGHILPKDQPRMIERIGAVLRPGGRLVFPSCQMPSRRSAVYWVARTFNAVMHVRNTLWKPPFLMYYLTFCLERAASLLERQGFAVDVREGIFGPPFSRLVLVTATWQRDPAARPNNQRRDDG